jgi:hypothetical protein
VITDSDESPARTPGYITILASRGNTSKDSTHDRHAGGLTVVTSILPGTESWTNEGQELAIAEDTVASDDLGTLHPFAVCANE